jgi:hypothetical protein
MCFERVHTEANGADVVIVIVMVIVIADGAHVPCRPQGQEEVDLWAQDKFQDKLERKGVQVGALAPCTRPMLFPGGTVVTHDDDLCLETLK